MWPQLGDLGRHLGALVRHLDQSLPKTAPEHSPKLLQENEPQTPNKPPNVMEGCSFLHFDHFPNNHSKMVQNYWQSHRKSSKLRPTWPSWLHHGALRAPTWSILRASCAHSRINFASTLHNIAPETQRNDAHTSQDLKMVSR